MKILGILLCLLSMFAFTARAQLLPTTYTKGLVNNSTNALQARGVLGISEDATNRLVIRNSGSASNLNLFLTTTFVPYPGSNSSVNASLYVTNFYGTAYTTNRTNLIVSGSGNVQANNNYTLKQGNPFSSAAMVIWTNNSGNNYAVGWNIDQSDNPDTYALTNSGGVDLYFLTSSQFSGIAGAWEQFDPLGTNPAPSVSYQIIAYQTNAIPVLVSSVRIGSAVPSNVAIVDSVNGNDDVRGADGIPFQSIITALTNSAFDTFYLVSRTNVGTSSILRAGTAMIGLGAGIVQLNATTTAFSNNCSVQNLTIVGKLDAHTGTGTTLTNILLRDLDVGDDLGLDGLLMSGAQLQGRAYNVYAHSAYDAFVIGDGLGTNADWELHDVRAVCVSHSVDDIVYPKRAILCQDAGRYRIYGGSATVSNSATLNVTYCIYLTMTNGSVELYGTRLKFGGTNGAFAFFNPNNIKVSGFWWENDRLVMAGGSFDVATNAFPPIPSSAGAMTFWNSNGSGGYWLKSSGLTWSQTNVAIR